MAAALNGGQLREIGRALREELARVAPSVCVVEDCHWADEATLDVLSYVGRRVGGTGSVLLVTFRDDELGVDHRLRVMVGSIPPADLVRVQLESLSRAAVAELAGPEADTDALFAATGGNPFLVTEALAAGGPRVPATVRDAVLARAVRLGGAARAELELVSVVPAAAEWWLVEDCLGEAGAAIGEAECSGLLVVEGQALRFRHEFARHAYEVASGAPWARAPSSTASTSPPRRAARTVSPATRPTATPPQLGAPPATRSTPSCAKPPSTPPPPTPHRLRCSC